MISKFHKTIEQYKSFDYNSYFKDISSDYIKDILNNSKLSELEYLALLSPIAENHLEAMAQKARHTTIRHFGKTIQLYTPMYISNHCTSQCLYCGFKNSNDIKRKQLDFDEIEKEAEAIAETGLRHILVLTGSARDIANTDYIVEAINIIRKYFTSISIEMYPMEEDEYKMLFDAGVDGLTIYQETYDEDLYKKLHSSGTKKDYHYRLSAPDRACSAGFRRINIGALLGLKDWRQDLFMAGLHCKYLEREYPATEISLSFPRIQQNEGGYIPQVKVSDKNMVQALTAFRLFMPRCGINISTREQASFRDNIIPLGITNMSAGTTTVVGGHTQKDTNEQFKIADTRSVSETKELIYKKGYQPVLKDWQYLSNQ